MQGQLEDKTLAHLLQFLSQDQASGALQLRNDWSEQGAIFFESGRVVHVVAKKASKRETGVRALSVLMTWTSGRFRFKKDVKSPEHTVRLSLDSLLLEAAYQADETERSAAGTLSPESVLSARTDDQGEQQTVAMTLRSIHLLRQFDGQRSLQKIAAGLGEPVEEIKKIAEELLQKSLIEIKNAPAVDPKFVDEVANFVIEKMGPIGEIIVEDTLYDLDSAEGLSYEVLPEFVSELREQLNREAWQREFDLVVSSLYETYDLE